MIVNGDRFGRLVVVNYEGRDASGVPLFLVICDCGGYLKVTRDALQYGGVIQCAVHPYKVTPW